MKHAKLFIVRRHIEKHATETDTDHNIVNLLSLNPNEPELATEGLTPEEVQHLERVKLWRLKGMAYAIEHGTRPATIGLVLSSNPLALLAW